MDCTYFCFVGYHCIAGQTVFSNNMNVSWSLFVTEKSHHFILKFEGKKKIMILVEFLPLLKWRINAGVTSL